MTARPLIITDCDEVLLHFAMPFGAYLAAEHAMDLKFESFSLAGSIRKRACGSTLQQPEVEPLIDGFMATHMTTQTPVPGAVAVLGRLAVHCDIVVLTNVKDSIQLARTHELARHGMPYPVIPNQGGKGGPVAALAAERPDAEILFIDDLPPHHTSVKTHAPQVHRLHMVADPQLQGLLPPAPDAHTRIDDWPTAEEWIRERLGLPIIQSG